MVAATTMGTAAAMLGTAETTSDAWKQLASNPAKRMEALKTQSLPGKCVLVRLDLNAPLQFNEATAALEVKYSHDIWERDDGRFGARCVVGRRGGTKVRCLKLVGHIVGQKRRYRRQNARLASHIPPSTSHVGGQRAHAHA